MGGRVGDEVELGLSLGEGWGWEVGIVGMVVERRN